MLKSFSLRIYKISLNVFSFSFFFLEQIDYGLHTDLKKQARGMTFCVVSTLINFKLGIATSTCGKLKFYCCIFFSLKKLQ